MASTDMVKRMLAGSPQALARLITLVERDCPEAPLIMQQVYERAGNAHVVGVTGPPGSGKSTLVDKLTAIARSKGLTVGIVAVDPSSPFTGGAVLGDRIRMRQHYLDKGVFIRSMATKGSQGGLPQAAKRVVRLLDAFHKDIVFVETVGVGQAELEIMDTADTVVVVLVPESGDTIQALKAGITEIADIFVVNKADRPGADLFAADLATTLALAPASPGWMPPILKTEAHKGQGVNELYTALEGHRQHLTQDNHLVLRRRKSRRREFLRGLRDVLMDGLERRMTEDRALAELTRQVEDGSVDPYWAASEALKDDNIFQRLLKGQPE